MNWQFTKHNTLREMTTGYEIHLLEGTWFHPKKLKPQPPENTGSINELDILKGGLKRIKMISYNAKNSDPYKIERAIAQSLMAS